MNGISYEKKSRLNTCCFIVLIYIYIFMYIYIYMHISMYVTVLTLADIGFHG